MLLILHSLYVFMVYFQVQEYLSLLEGITKVTTNEIIIGLMNANRNNFNKHVLTAYACT